MDTIHNTIKNIINMSHDDIIKFVFMCSGFGYHWDKNIDTYINPMTNNFNINNNYIEVILDHDYIGDEMFDYENIVICFNNRETSFEIRNMKNFLQSYINTEYFSKILIFKLDTQFIDIIQDVKDYIINRLNNENNRLKQRQCNCDEIDEDELYYYKNDNNLCKFNMYGKCEKIIEHNENLINNILSFQPIPINTEVVDFINYPYFTKYVVRGQFQGL